MSLPTSLDFSSVVRWSRVYHYRLLLMQQGKGKKMEKAFVLTYVKICTKQEIVNIY